MRVLYITNGFPYPLTSGYLRHYHFIRGLSGRHEIELLSVVGGDFRPEHRSGLDPFTTRIETFQSTGRSRSIWRKATRRGRDLLFARGTDAAGRALARRAGQLLQEAPYDAVVLSGKRTDPVIDRVGQVPLVVDMCDATSMRLAGSLSYALPARRALLWLELHRVRAVEARLMQAGRRLLFASARDRDLLLDGSRAADATVVPNGVDLDYWRRDAESLGQDEIVFSGAMSYPPNEDAARYLMLEIMPRVWSVEPAVRLRVVGRDPTPRLRRAATDPRIVLTGFVDDVRPHLDSAAVFAAPLRFAAGIQNKLLEAMAMEIPTITTPVAAAGLQLPGTESAPVTVASTTATFVRELLDALAAVRRDPTPRAELRRFVAARFTWDRALTALERVLVDATRSD